MKAAHPRKLLAAFVGVVAMTLTIAAEARTPTVIVPSAGEPAYRVAGEVFCEMWEKVAGAKPRSARDDGKLPAGDIVLIGSDAVNPVVHRLILQARIENLGIRYGTDDYRILSLPEQNRTLLILAGGMGRSTIYAVYDFFRKKAGVEYFWDGDVIPKRASIELTGCDFTERPHFEYRGLRYFAHRGPHRFHAELWDFEDWKREIDWMLKNRLNLFMLRTGIDDLFQRAFGLPYPPEDGVDSDAELRSYNDRTSFWPLKYRGELRKRVLAYARERGLIHPEDTGTITHWYSHTPGSFYEKYPDMPVMHDKKSGYQRATHRVWDAEHERTWDTYWKLTETHIREFGEPRMFHTIGLAERSGFSASYEEDIRLKLFGYRKIQEVLRRHYPDAPLLIASWDLMGWWKNEDVHRLLAEFDPQRTILLEYTADLLDRKTYRDWDVCGKFPWIFGVFHAYAGDSEVRENYRVLQERISEVVSDPQCVGLVLWPEISHSNTLLLEYLTANGWRPDQLDANAFVGRFCASRYPSSLVANMEAAWQSFLPIAGAHNFTHRATGQPAMGLAVQQDPHFRILTSPEYTNITDERARLHAAEFERLSSVLREAPAVLERLAQSAKAGYANELWRRDALDITRTIITRALKASLMRSCAAIKAGHGNDNMETVSKGLMQQLGDVLALSDDFSLHATMKRLERARELGGVKPRINPHTEQTLKGNSENNYCRGAHQYELVRYVYQAELDEYWKWVNSQLQSSSKKPWTRPASFTASKKTIQDRFYDTPLAKMAPKQVRSAENLNQTLNKTRALLVSLLGSNY